MESKIDIDYGDLIFSKRYEIDQLAYLNYYFDCPVSNFDDNDIIIEDAEDDDNLPLTFNSWYGTESHKRYVIPLLRKMKLEKIKKSIF